VIPKNQYMQGYSLPARITAINKVINIHGHHPVYVIPGWCGVGFVKLSDA
jgi:hypothetical protein